MLTSIQKGNFSMWCRIRQFLSQLVLAIAIVLLLFIGLDNFTTQPALASIRQMEEAPGQILIQSRHTLKDEQGDSVTVHSPTEEAIKF